MMIQDMIKEMNPPAKDLDAMPDNAKWEIRELDALEDVRHAALKLATATEACLEAANTPGTDVADK